MTTQRPAPVDQWDSSPRRLLIVLAVFVVLVVVGYRLAVPRLAQSVANQIPQELADGVGAGVLSALDAQMLAPTRLPDARQRQLASALASLRPPASVARPRLHVVFRSSPALGANAIALPSGTIVVTDELVALAGDDREILGTLAHEAGHVAHRHGLRLIVQNSMAAVTMGWLLGDLGAIAAVAPRALLEAKYSRDLEREADAYAAAMLRANGISPRYLARMLERLESAQSSRPGTPGVEYLSSHPATAERIAALRAGTETP